MSEVFPSELTDRIIGCMDKLDKRTLCSCALVSRKWLPASRHALFHLISIQRPSTFKLLIDRVLHSDNARPCLAGVRVLAIDDFNTGLDTSVFDHHPVPEISDGEGELVTSACRLFIYDFSGHLPGVQRLNLSGLRWTYQSTPRPHEALFLSQFSSLKTLSLMTCFLPSFSFLRRALIAVPQLERLSLLFVSWHPADRLPAVMTSFTTRPRLRNIRISPAPSLHARPSGWLLLWLCQTSTPHVLRNLEVFGDGILDNAGSFNEGYAEFLKGPFPHLRKLRIPLASMYSFPKLYDKPVLIYLSLTLRRSFPYKSRSSGGTDHRVKLARGVRMQLGSIVRSTTGDAIARHKSYNLRGRLTRVG